MTSTAVTSTWCWWKPKALNRDVTNLELWALSAVGIVIGLVASGRWSAFVLIAVLPASLAIDWWRAYCGLDQWPNPRGRYYNRWLALPKGHGDYYAWLSREMKGREPWAEWARREREMEVGHDLR